MITLEVARATTAELRRAAERDRLRPRRARTWRWLARGR